jgi:S-formylglutathione hydrolase FrmB
VAKALLEEIDNRYRTIRSRGARAVAGLSMGGYAAIKSALKYSDSYIVAGSLSGALHVGGDLDKREQQYRDRILRVFGPESSPSRSENNVFDLLDKANPPQLPYRYLACGIEDRFLDTNRQLAQQLSERKIAYEFHETSGAHDWDYRDRSLRGVLPVIADKLSLVTTTPSP